jgi:hypothetical protein
MAVRRLRMKVPLKSLKIHVFKPHPSYNGSEGSGQRHLPQRDRHLTPFQAQLRSMVPVRMLARQ